MDKSKLLFKWGTTKLQTLRVGPLYFLNLVEKLKNWLLGSISPIRFSSLQELLPGQWQTEVFLPFGYVKPGSTPVADLLTLAILTRVRSPKKVFEIGTFEGLTAVLFAKNGGLECRIATLDLPENPEVPRSVESYGARSVNGPYESGYLISEMGCTEQIVRLLGDSALFDFEPFSNSVDLFFIDGAHTEFYVQRDTLAAFKCIKPDGWVIWHDCLVPEVAKVIRQIAKYIPVYHIQNTNLVITLRKPESSLNYIF